MDGQAKDSLHEILNETRLYMVDVPARCARNSNGKAPHLNTIVRWMKQGVRGARLEYVRLGGRLVTSEEALARFFAAINATDRDLSPAAAPPLRSPVARRKAVEKTDRELAEAGF